MQKVDFYGVSLDLIDTSKVLELYNEYLYTKGTKTIFFLNAHYYNLSCKNIEYRKALNDSSLLLNDGIGIRLGLKFKKIKEKENMNGTDLIPKIIEFSEKSGKRIFLLGADETSVTNAYKNLTTKYKKIIISGYNNGYFQDDETIIRKINNSGAEVLILGMGAPYQELWAQRNKDKLEKVKVIVAGGAIIDFISGKVTRAPRVIRIINCEWLYRLYLEPRRLFKRYIVGNMVFFVNIFCNRRSFT